MRLAVNDTKNVLIDAWVSSGPDVRELKKSLFLLGGRSYSLVLEFFKFKDKTASIDLQWKTPHGVVGSPRRSRAARNPSTSSLATSDASLPDRPS